MHHLNDAHHFSIVPLWLGTDDQKAFWKDLGHWLRAIDCCGRAAKRAEEVGRIC